MRRPIWVWSAITPRLNGMGGRLNGGRWDHVTHLLGGDRPLVGLAELLNHSGVAPEILLAADEDDGETSAEVHDFGNPLHSACATVH